MKIGIIGAMEEEIRTLKSRLENPTSWTRAGIVFYQGIIERHEVILVQSGIGKVQSAMVATLLIQNFDVKAIINTGSAGGIGEGMTIGDLVISDEVAYWDVDVTAFGYAKGQLPGQPQKFEASRYLLSEMKNAATSVGQNVQTGLIITGDQFVNSTTEILKIKNHFPNALACEMEGAAIAHVAHQFHTAFLVVRAISDTADHKATQSFDEFIIEAGKKSAEVVLAFLKFVK